jgi:hypothetical protein
MNKLMVFGIGGAVMCCTGIVGMSITDPFGIGFYFYLMSIVGVTIFGICAAIERYKESKTA